MGKGEDLRRSRSRISKNWWIRGKCIFPQIQHFDIHLFWSISLVIILGDIIYIASVEKTYNYSCKDAMIFILR